MKIRHLKIANFKTIKSLNLENIPDLVVIAGPNGCGKTSIFDAIRIFKAIMGPYSSQELNYIQSRELKNQIKNVVNLTSEFAEITIGIEPSESEKNYLSEKFNEFELELAQHQGLLKGTIKIQNTGQCTITESSNALMELLKHFDPTDEIGTFEYIPAYREVPLGDIGSITMKESIEQDNLERTATVKEKFNRLKHYLAMMTIFDKMDLSYEHPAFLPEVKDFFEDFFHPKEFEGVKVTRPLTWQFPVITPDGVHDIDFLSSGEKEILMTYVNILRMKLTGSVILFDEPDLHLNAALERKLISRLNKIVAAGNQIWITTHSLEIIGTVPLENLFKMYIDVTLERTNQIELCSTNMDRIKTLEDIGASVGIQLISQKIIFVEGDTDKEILRALYDDYSDVITFEKTKGLRSLMGLGSLVTSLLDRVTKYDNFYMIRDRDLLTDDEINEIQQKYKGKVFVWKSRSIENYLVKPEILIKILNELGITEFANETEVLNALKQIANDLKIRFLADLINQEINRKLTSNQFGTPPVETEEELKEKILEIGEAKRNSLVEQLSNNNLNELYLSKKAYVDSIWEHNCLQLCDGKRLIQEFINRHITPHGRTINVPAIQSLIVNKMKSTENIPTDIQNVMDSILK